MRSGWRVVKKTKLMSVIFIVSAMLNVLLYLSCRRSEDENRHGTLQMKPVIPKTSYNATTAMKNRSNFIMKLCATKRYNFTRMYTGLGKALASMESRKLLYCPIPKAGWSAWKLIFYREAGIEHLMYDYLHTGFLSEWNKAGLKVVVNKELYTTSTEHRLVFVRNPYERLVSAYKDKVLSDNGRYVKKFHEPCKFVNPPPEPALTFSQFIRCIVQAARTDHANIAIYGSGSGLDVHWRPQTLLCNFCAVNYNIFGHIEHMDDDLKESMRVMAMESSAPPKENPSETASARTLPIEFWYSQLSDELLSQLRTLYSYDFDLLGYSPIAPQFK